MNYPRINLCRNRTKWITAKIRTVPVFDPRAVCEDGNAHNTSRFGGTISPGSRCAEANILGG